MWRRAARGGSSRIRQHRNSSGENGSWRRKALSIGSSASWQQHGISGGMGKSISENSEMAAMAKWHHGVNAHGWRQKSGMAAACGGWRRRGIGENHQQLSAAIVAKTRSVKRRRKTRPHGGHVRHHLAWRHRRSKSIMHQQAWRQIRRVSAKTRVRNGISARCRCTRALSRNHLHGAMMARTACASTAASVPHRQTARISRRCCWRRCARASRWHYREGGSGIMATSAAKRHRGRQNKA